MSTCGGSEDFGVRQTCRRVASIWDVHLWRVRGCSCSPACLIRNLALVSHLIQTICSGSLHLCRIATTVMSFCCTLHVNNIVYQVVVVHIYYYDYNPV